MVEGYYLIDLGYEGFDSVIFTDLAQAISYAEQVNVNGKAIIRTIPNVPNYQFQTVWRQVRPDLFEMFQNVYAENLRNGEK